MHDIRLPAFSALAALSWTQTDAPIEADDIADVAARFAGSMSMPPTILKPGRPAICRAIAAPIGPGRNASLDLARPGNYSARGWWCHAATA
jgi:hypothetical protein